MIYHRASKSREEFMLKMSHVGLHRAMYALTVALLASHCLQGRLFAQTDLAEITGEITDPAGADVPDAKVTITNTATGVKSTLVTNDAGMYHGRSMIPGVYDIFAE